MKKFGKWSWLALWALQVASVRAQGLPPGAPPVPPDTEEVERQRAADSGTVKAAPAPSAPAAPSGTRPQPGNAPATPHGTPAAASGARSAPGSAPAAPPVTPVPTGAAASVELPSAQVNPPATPSGAGSPSSAPAAQHSTNAPAAAPDGAGGVPAAPSGSPSAPSDAATPSLPPGAAAPAPAGPVASDAHSAGEAVPPAPAAPAEPPPPSAAGPAPALWSVGALLGLGVTFDHTTAGVNPLGFGFGLRGDYRIAEPWVVGARVLYFVGGSSGLPSGRLAMQSWIIAAEGSYLLHLDPLILQPGLALGLHVRDIDHRVLDVVGPDPVPSDLSRTQVGLYIAPGLSVILPLGTLAPEVDNLFAGMDVRLDLALGSRVTSNLQLLFQAGIRF